MVLHTLKEKSYASDSFEECKFILLLSDVYLDKDDHK